MTTQHQCQRCKGTGKDPIFTKLAANGLARPVACKSCGGKGQP